MTRDVAEKLLLALQVVQDELPAIGMIIDEADPPAIPFVAAAQPTLGKIFEVASVYLASQTDDAARATLRASAAKGWEVALGAGSKVEVVGQ